MAVCTLSPDALFFPWPHDRSIENILLITNHHVKDTTRPCEGTLIFKLKSNNPQRYVVRPRIGLVPPGTTRTIHVTLRMTPDTAAVTHPTNDRFLLEVKTVVKEFFSASQAICESGSPLSHGAPDATDHETSNILRGIFDAGSECSRIPISCHYQGFEWVLNSGRHAPRDAANSQSTHTGKIILRNTAGAITSTVAASLEFDGEDPSATSRPVGTPPKLPNDSEPPSDSTPGPFNPLVPSDAERLKRASRLLLMNDAVDKKRAEAAALKAELTALRNQTKQLQDDCANLIKASKKHADTLGLLNEPKTQKARPGCLVTFSFSLPVVALLVIAAFVVSYLFNTRNYESLHN